MTPIAMREITGVEIREEIREEMEMVMVMVMGTEMQMGTGTEMETAMVSVGHHLLSLRPQEHNINRGRRTRRERYGYFESAGDLDESTRDNASAANREHHLVAVSDDSRRRFNNVYLYHNHNISLNPVTVSIRNNCLSIDYTGNLDHASTRDKQSSTVNVGDIDSFSESKHVSDLWYRRS